MRDNFVKILISIVLIVLLILLLDPFMVLMPSSAQMALIAAVMIIFVSFCIFVWKEKSKDEREDFHKQISSRFAYLSGAAVLIVGVVYQSFNHSLDPWLVIALIVMILAKISGTIYASNKH